MNSALQCMSNTKELQEYFLCEFSLVDELYDLD
jgi:hypothetical protein